MNDDHRKRMTIATVLLVVLTLLSCFRLLPTDATVKHKGKDEVTLSEARFNALKPYLPPRGTVGYWRGESTTNWKAIALVQYALVPLIVSNTTTTRLVIGDFLGTTNRTSPGKQFSVTAEGGPDLVLYKREDL